MSKPVQHKYIKRPAIRIDQNQRYPLYLFSLTGEELSQIADISRISRDAAGRLQGYQRAEVKRHIRNIAEYLDTDDILFPNSLILSLSRDVKFTVLNATKGKNESSTLGYLQIGVPRTGTRKPGWIVDGQQRAMALAKTRRKHFPVAVSAFVADDVNLQRDQFLRVNSTKPLPRGLITELLPTVSSILPANLSVRRVPSALCDLLNDDPQSPFYGLIRRSSMNETQRKRAVIVDTAIVQILQDSLGSASGCLFPYRNLATGETDLKGMQSVLFTFWDAVRETFPKAWGLPPTQSRLMHSAGLRAMGKLMDRMMSSVDPRDRHASAKLRQDLIKLRPICHWTSGQWNGLGGLEWNHLQNLPGHIRSLSNLLLRSYVSLEAHHS